VTTRAEARGTEGRGGARAGGGRELVARWLPVVGWATLISVFSTGWFAAERTGSLLLPLLAALFPDATPQQLAAAHYGVRKLAHFTEYLVLSVLLYRALRGERGWSLRAAALALAISGLYAIADELHQGFVAGRTAAAADCLIDFSGAATGQGLLAARPTGRRPVAGV
jgi:VanZ family protein